MRKDTGIKVILNIALVTLSFVPFLFGIVAVAFFLPDVIPMRVGIGGDVNWYGGKVEELLFAGILTAVNLLCAFCGIFAENLWAAGLISGVKTPGAARVVVLGTILFMDLVFVAILIWQCTA